MVFISDLYSYLPPRVTIVVYVCVIPVSFLCSVFNFLASKRERGLLESADIDTCKYFSLGRSGREASVHS